MSYSEQEKQRQSAALFENLPETERMKYEIAGELGLLDQIKKEGWKSLSARETGRIGGLMTRRKREKSRKTFSRSSQQK